MSSIIRWLTTNHAGQPLLTKVWKLRVIFLSLWAFYRIGYQAKQTTTLLSRFSSYLSRWFFFVVVYKRLTSEPQQENRYERQTLLIFPHHREYGFCLQLVSSLHDDFVKCSKLFRQRKNYSFVETTAASSRVDYFLQNTFRVSQSNF